MSTHEDPDLVRPALRRAEAELARHLEEACEDHENIGDESTEELLRLEEELLAAARAADEAVRLRRKLGEGTSASPTAPDGQQPPADRAPGGPPAETSLTELPAAIRVREFRTAAGIEWRVWEVRPGAGGRARKPGLYPAEYAEGWLAFERLQGGEGRKRLPKFGPDWCNVSDADLEALLEQAVEVRTRKRELPGSPNPGL